MSKRGRKKAEIGRVTSDGMNKTITVAVERREKHPLYGKTLKRITACKAHDESNEARKGDRVRIMACRPLSKTKRWRLVEVLERGQID